MRQSQVVTIARALRAVERLAARDMSASELARTFEVDRGTAARLLATLQDAGYVERAEGDTASARGGGRYRVAAAKIIALYGLVEDRIELVQLATPILAELRDRTGETANVSVMIDDAMMYVALQRSRASVSAVSTPGRRRPLHCSAIGKACAAYMRSEQVAEMLVHAGMELYTPRTIATPAAFLSHLERVCQLGYAVDDEETEFGMRCVAAPVRDYSGGVIAAIGISGPSNRVTAERIPEMARSVVAGAARLSLALGWEGRAHTVPAIGLPV